MNLPLEILALVIAVLLWFNAVLDRSYVTSITVPVLLDRIETKKVISEFETRAAIVTLEGKGKDLLGLRLSRPRFRLTVPEGRAGIHQLKLAAADLRIPAKLDIRSINPEAVELRLNEVGTRRVGVKVPVRGTPAKGLTITDIKPVSQVELVGPKDDVRLHATVFTESLDLKRVTGDDTLRLRVIPPEGDNFSTEPETVGVVVAVDKEEARIFLGIPIGLIAPESVRASVKPAEAQIAVAGPESRLGRLQPVDIKARIKLSGIEPGQHRLAAEIALPPEFHLIKCEPALFEVTVE